MFLSNMTGMNDSQNYFSSNFSSEARERWTDLPNKILYTAIHLSIVKNNDWLPLEEVGQCASNIKRDYTSIVSAVLFDQRRSLQRWLVV